MFEKIKRRISLLIDRRLYKPFCRSLSPVLSPTLLEKHPRGMAAFHEEKKHIFFGYYDTCPFDADNRYLLACRTDHGVSTPHIVHPVLNVGYYDLHDAKPAFIKLGTTSAWNWQQGCRLQFFDDCRKIIYNVFDKGDFRAEILEFPSGKGIKTLSVPVYAMSPDGKTALTLNFSRLHRLRAGYGYSQKPDKTAGAPAPEDDGLFIVDMATGTSSLLFSLDRLAKMKPVNDMQGATHYLNHLDYNPGGNKISFMHIWLTPAGKRRNRIVVCNIDGSDITIPTNEGHASHHRWKSDHEILIYSRRIKTGMHYHLYDINTGSCEVVGGGRMKEDGHPSFLSAHTILSDTYPDPWNIQRLFQYDILKTKLGVMGRFYSPPAYTKEMRCDLHPRVSKDKSLACVDYVKDGYRAIGVIDLRQ